LRLFADKAKSFFPARSGKKHVLLFCTTGYVQAQNAEQERAIAASLVDAINRGSMERRKPSPAAIRIPAP
jgi:hypothetical protein